MGLFRIPFEVKIADIDESMDPDGEASAEVARVSRLKAMAVERGADDIVIAADTIVVCDGKILGKPVDQADAHRMLRLLSGHTHQVITGMTVVCGQNAVSCAEITDVTFRELSDKEIDAYIATGEPMDKAGSYGIQGGAALFCQSLHGDYYNVMGLPVCRLFEILRGIAPELMGDML